MRREPTPPPTGIVNVQAEDVIAQARQALYHVNTSDQAPVSGRNLPSPSRQPSGTHGGTSIYFAGVNLGEISSYSGIPFFSAEGQQWISSRTGQTLGKICLSGPPWQSAKDADTGLSTTPYPPPGSNFGLPSRDHAEECLSKFATSKFRLVFPVVDPVLFQHTLDVAYAEHAGPPSFQVTSAKTCVLAFLSMVALIYKELDISKPLDGHALAQTAKNLRPQVLYDTSIEGLQAILMLACSMLPLPRSLLTVVLRIGNTRTVCWANTGSHDTYIHCLSHYIHAPCPHVHRPVHSFR